MARRGSAVHVVTTKRHYKGKVYQTHLLRRSYRENGQVKNETLANLSHLPPAALDAVQRSLKGETLVPVGEAFEVIDSPQHGHVDAVLRTLRRLGFERLLAARPSRERDRAVAMVAARILEPDSKLATTRWWHTTTLPQLLRVSDADEDDLYAAMDWLVKRQDRIEKKLVARHLEAGGFVLYDLTSSYFEGMSCPLAALGKDRDGKKGKLQVNYGLLTDVRGCPVSVSVFPGSTGDPKTLLPQVKKVRESFGIEKVVLVGDRGMISQKQIDVLQGQDGVDWITALKSAAIRALMEGGHLQLGLFDERNLFELCHPDFPGERLVACRNPELGRRRGAKRQALLEATREELQKVQQMVERGRVRGREAIGERLHQALGSSSMGRHVRFEIHDDGFELFIDEDELAAEAALDGLYVVRTSLPEERLSAADTVRTYKALSQVERAFRSLKTVDLKVRPIRHHLETRVRAHIFLCMLAYYVEWHMREAWRPLLFADEDLEAKRSRDPVAPARRSDAVLRKVHSKTLEDGSPVHSFSTLLKLLSGIVRNVCRLPGQGPEAPTFHVSKIPDATQQRAFDLIEALDM